ncbi:sulfatase family protein [Breznakiella homolactica]|uniref:Sulfatase-like hydrolase/transferase n=1 Tax=Breznakiella homolactica TaxID=2798577 RepID=A0A7T7XNK4_9SPIR|nr:sulfatase-like hydrolase/transferase [Breznakiella homolactica]QQO09616.1 sulfatase-like hydrolase/transferase [Breznakiella homolactica]
MDARKSPNILWICTDQQRFDTLGCYGNTFVSTPVLDSLARESALFENAFCQSPVCTPSRGSFLTGRYPVTSHTRQNGADIPPTEKLVTKIFHDAGYYCGLSGKLHLSACNPAAGATEMEPRINDGYDEFHWSHDTSPSWGIQNEYYRWLKEVHNTGYKTEQRSDTKWVQNGMPVDQTQAYWCAQKAVDFIEQRKDSGKPWLFSVNMYDPHHPFDAPEELLQRYLGKLDDIPLPSYRAGEELEKPVWQRQDHTGAYNHNAGYPYTEMSDTDHRLIRASYWAMCDLIDMQVGRMLDALDETGQRENTIVIFMSDHGELLGDHGIYLKGPFFYECSVKVPLIIHWKNRIAPKGYKALAELNDLPQTLLDLCGLPAYEGMQGQSLEPLLEGRTGDSHHESVYCEYLNAMPWHKDPKAFATMVRTDRYKLVAAHSDNSGELYDLEEDPGEHTNQYGSPRYAAVKTELLEKLLNRWCHTADPLPVRKSDW